MSVCFGMIFVYSGGHFVCHLSDQGNYFEINQDQKIRRSAGLQNCQVFIYQRKINDDTMGYE